MNKKKTDRNLHAKVANTNTGAPKKFNPFMPCPINGTLVNSVDPDQMQHNVIRSALFAFKYRYFYKTRLY